MFEGNLEGVFEGYLDVGMGRWKEFIVLSTLCDPPIRPFSSQRHESPLPQYHLHILLRKQVGS